MDASKQKRSVCVISKVPRSVMTRSQCAASVVNSKADVCKISLSKRKNESPGKMATKKSVFRDLTNRETGKDVSLGKISDDSITAAAKKLANTKLHDKSTKKSNQLLRKVKATTKSAAPNDGMISSYFKITKQPPKIFQTSDLKLKKIDETAVQPKSSLLSSKVATNSFKQSDQTCLKKVPQPLDVKNSQKENEKENVLTKPGVEVGNKKINSCSSQESGSPSLYVTALEELSSVSNDRSTVFESPKAEPAVPPPKVLPPGVTDYDAENWDDPFQVSNYATDIFNYFKSMEAKYNIPDYMPSQKDVTSGMRAVVVDWMVELQENFELNHETLYLAVKLVDCYLSKTNVMRNNIQLVAAAAIFIASKYDERFPPSIEDTLYVCEGAYTKKQLLDMEISILKAVDFNLGFPISYRYLRRYARYGRVCMQTLTLARYILECSLMDYSFVSESDSKLAASALLLALKMKGIDEWSPNLQHSSGYKVVDLEVSTRRLNNMLHKIINVSKLTAVKQKYSHKVFYEVTKVPLISVLAF